MLPRYAVRLPVARHGPAELKAAWVLDGWCTKIRWQKVAWIGQG